jgi:hypothetical protein
MVRKKISDTVKGIVLGLSRTNQTYKSIQKELKTNGYNFSLGSINNVRYGIGLQRSATSPNATDG